MQTAGTAVPAYSSCQPVQTLFFGKERKNSLPVRSLSEP